MHIITLLFLIALSLAAERNITVVTRSAPTTYYLTADGTPTGFEYDMISAFAKAKSYRVKLIVKHSVQEVIEELHNDAADIAAAGLTRTYARAEKFFTLPGYYDVQEQIVCGYDKRPQSIDDLSSYTLQVTKNSCFTETLNELSLDYPDLNWSESEHDTTEQIFAKIAQGNVDCTVSDSHVIAINRRFFPQLHVAFALSEKERLVWLMPKNRRTYALYNEMVKWFLSFRDSQTYDQIKSRHFAHTTIFDYVDLSIYHRRIKKRFPRYVDAFRKSGEKYGIDWRLLAAQAYQESHWNPRAKSPTGVRGMMMLTRTTAKELGIKNRLNYQHSIEGGAKYLKQLIDRLPADINTTLERYKFALAAYNVGMGHIHDAFTLSKRMRQNPYDWVSMQKTLPLLEDSEVFNTLNYGYARGSEPVEYVMRIMNYYDIMKQYYDLKNHHLRR